MPSALDRLHPESFTAQRLAHASPEHLYLTSRRCFIGPIPAGWLKSHRRDWYKDHFHYSSRTATFHPRDGVSQARRLSGLEGPSASTSHRPISKQPVHVWDNGSAGTVPLSEQHQEDERTVARHVKSEGDGDALEGSRPPDDATPRMSEACSSAVERPGPNDSPKQGTSTKTSERSNGLEVPPRNPASWRTTGATSPVVSMADSQSGPAAYLVAKNGTESTKSLLERRKSLPARDSADAEAPLRTDGPLARVAPRTSGDDVDDDPAGSSNLGRAKKALVSFAVQGDSKRADILSKAGAMQLGIARSASGLLKSRPKDGRIIKMEKMLVRVEISAENQLPDDYDENSSQGIVSRTSSKFREFMVVCRESTEVGADFVLQMYKSRVIPALQDGKSKTKTKYQITLDKKTSHVNLYSPLDKSVVIWVPYARGTTIFILRPRSSANAVNWLTFLRNMLGWRRAQDLTVNVPDLCISLRLKNPFKELEAIRNSIDVGEPNENALKKTMDEEQTVASKITQRCLDMLQTDHGWREVVDMWKTKYKVGLAWKRYDRLEWIHGANERKMYGTIAMLKSHELELRPKSHFAMSTTTRKGKTLTEPAPVEGFLIRLTSRKGVHQKIGKLFFKRLYFATHDQYLVFTQPANAHPPPPPKLPAASENHVPDARQVAEKMPLIYAVNPFPVHDGQIAWLDDSRHSDADMHHSDEEAAGEAERKLKTLLDCDGYINLTNVLNVRNINRDATPDSDALNDDSDEDTDESGSDTGSGGGQTTKLDDEHCFELVLKNGLVVRLQAYDKTTKTEWKKRLRRLVHYWKHRTRDEMELYKSVRRQNLDQLRIDEDAEATMGQFAKKWEVTQTFASPLLYNMCGISSCRAIHLSGALYRKARLHSSFSLSSVLLVSGHLLVFSPALRTRTGRDVPTIHHDRQAALDLDLSQCYLYSGLLTENELLYRNTTFDSNRPGRSGLHRWYADDAWRVSDEDVTCTFVLWYQRRKQWLRAPGSSAVKALAARAGGEEGKPGSPSGRRGAGNGDGERRRARLKRVSQLGVTGRNVVFKARSRAERDRWVLALSTEIDRLAGAEDVRLTTGK